MPYVSQVAAKTASTPSPASSGRGLKVSPSSYTARRVTNAAAMKSSQRTTGDTGGAAISGGTARTDHSTHSPSQVLCSTAIAGGRSPSSIQFERGNFSPTFGDEVNRDVGRQRDSRHAAGGGHDDERHW